MVEARIARAIKQLSEDSADLLSGSANVASILDLMEEYFDRDSPQGNARKRIILYT